MLFGDEPGVGLPGSAAPNILEVGHPDMGSQVTPTSVRHHCPVSECKASYSAAQTLLNHIESIHLARENAGVVVSDAFLQAYSRWTCCGLFMPLHKACRERSKPGPRERGRRPKDGELPANRRTLSEVSVGWGSPEVPPGLLAQTEAILSSPVGSLHHLPPATRKTLGDAFACALKRLHERKDAWSAWQVVLFPRLVLSPLSRGCRKHNRQATGIILDRLRRWNAGALSELTLQATPLPGKKVRQEKPGPMGAEDSLPPSLHRAVVSAVTDGALSKAAKLLYKGGAPSDDLEALRALHPQRETAASPIAISTEDKLEFEVAEIRQACKRFPPGSTGGPSSLRPCHLQELLAADEDDLLAQALADFVSDFNAGVLPLEAQSWFCGARLIALQKQPPGGKVLNPALSRGSGRKAPTPPDGGRS